MEPKPPRAKPNVFFVYIDDMGWNDIGYQSSDVRAMTPNLNRMAEGGVKLTQYYSMSVCTPARAALMTGRYAIRYGFQYSIIRPGAPWGLPLTEKLLPEYMNDAGYTSHMVGKWHLGGHTIDHMPHRRGFETHLGYTYGAETYWTHGVQWNSSDRLREGPDDFLDFGFGNETDYYDVIEGPRRPHPAADGSTSTTVPTSIAKGHRPPSSVRGNKYSTEIFTDRALEILRGKTPFDEEPLFLYLAHQAVHEPLELPPDDAFSADETAVLDALKDSPDWVVRVDFAKILMFLDKTVGRLMDYLDEEGWLENSIIVVASDNGGCPSFGGSNHPLRGVKDTYWEGGTKVPALVYSPSHIPGDRWGKEYDGLMHVTDWLPTLAAAAEFELSGSHGDLDGINHWEQITKGSHDSLGQDFGDSDRWSSSSSSRIVSSNGAYVPRSEMLYNFDPYYFVAQGDGTMPKPDFNQAQGAFRHGKWKFLFNVCSFDSDYDQPVAPPAKVEEGAASYCNICTETCVDKDACIDWLFDLEQDPREEHNLASAYPEVVNGLRERLYSVVNQEFSDSLYVDIDPNARSAWKSNDYWVVPWLHHGGYHASADTETEPRWMLQDPWRIA